MCGWDLELMSNKYCGIKLENLQKLFIKLFKTTRVRIAQATDLASIRNLEISEMEIRIEMTFAYFS